MSISVKYATADGFHVKVVPSVEAAASFLEGVKLHKGTKPRMYDADTGKVVSASKPKPKVKG